MNINIVPHPHFLEFLFTSRKEVYSIFRDILGLYEIHHLSIARIVNFKQIICFSSTPALEFNLFKDNLWTFDKTYHPQWFRNENWNLWSELYALKRFEELYYTKQTKYHYSIGYSLSTKKNNTSFIFSFASKGKRKHVQELFQSKLADLSKIGWYCTKQLNALFALEPS